MCQIISKEYTNRTHAKANMIKIEIDELIETLDVKGSDEYSFFCYGQKSNNDPLVIKCPNIFEFREELKILHDYLNLLDEHEPVGMVWFSRQKPEEEDGDVELPPYFNKRTDSWYWIHGTISNDRELLEEFRERERIEKFHKELLTISVDTEIFKYLKEQDFPRLKGLYTYFSLKWGSRIQGVKAKDKGMGLWVKDRSTYSTMQCSPFNNKAFQVLPKSTEVPIDNISIAFSGGMDITLNAWKVLADLDKRNKISFFKDNLGTQKITLNYFKYGSNAEEEEIKTCIELTSFFQENFTSLKIDFQVLEVPGLIYNMAEVSGEYLKLTDKEAIGDSKETEENLAYVPYRNTLFCMALNAKLQKENDRNTRNFIVLGLNLSEGMVFGDNNSAWLENTEKMLTYGGKFYQEVKIISPYLNRTKTNTLKEFQEEFGSIKLQQLLDLSFSCYYPQDGKPCNECGSCILRNKAIANIQK